MDVELLVHSVGLGSKMILQAPSMQVMENSDISLNDLHVQLAGKSNLYWQNFYKFS